MAEQKNAKVAIVTAASKGMGAGISRELAARGYKVVLMSTSNGAIELAKELGGVGMQGSVSSNEDLQKVVELALTTYGRIDAVVNNTGHPPSGDLLSLSDEQWSKGMELVFLNTVRMCRLVTPQFLKQGTGGSIVNISTYATFEPDLSFPVSSAFRASLAAYVKLYADKYARDNIRINNILPGFIETWNVTDDYKNQIPMKRAGTVKEIAKTAAFLLGDDSSYITGQNIKVDGGLARSV